MAAAGSSNQIVRMCNRTGDGAACSEVVSDGGGGGGDPSGGGGAKGGTQSTRTYVDHDATVLALEVRHASRLFL